MPLTQATRFDELKATGQLPSPTGVAMQILRMADSERTTTAEISRILQADPALAGRILKLANSSCFGRTRPVTSVREAVTHLGTRMVRNVALGFSLVSQYGQGACQAFDYGTFWSRALAMGVAAQAGAYFSGQIAPSEAFTCGLLSTVGRLALASLYPEIYGRALEQADPYDAGDLCRRERDHFATDHNELTGALLKDWGLPEPCVDAAQHHEHPDQSGFPADSRTQALVRLLHLAAKLADVCVAPEEERSSLVLDLFVVATDVGIPAKDLIDLCDRVVGEWQDWGKVLNVGTRTVPPMAELAERARQAEAAADGVALPTEGGMIALQVVVIDDDAVERSLLSAHLRKAGHSVAVAVDGVEGLKTVLEVNPQLVITDRMMPGMDGVTLCRALRQTKMGRQLYVLMLTGSEDEQSQVEAFEAGADDYLVKPCRPKILAARLRACQRLLHLQEEVRRDKEELRRYMADLSVANRKLQQAALTDALTGLYNRRYAMDRLEQEWAEASRSGGLLAALILDIDHFKKINDTYGHDIGDVVLCETAGQLRATLRGSDVVCRLGGEEFLVIASGIGAEAALACGERLRRAIEENHLETAAGSLRVTLSLGAAVRTPAMRGPQDLLKAADLAVYAAKQGGRNCVRLAGPELVPLGE